jgi:hypothetical protein
MSLRLAVVVLRLELFQLLRQLLVLRLELLRAPGVLERVAVPQRLPALGDGDLRLGDLLLQRLQRQRPEGALLGVVPILILRLPL